MAIFPQLHVVYAQWTDVWSLNYWCGYWSVMYLLNCCVVIELTKTKYRVLILKQMADHIKLVCSSLVLKVNDDIWEYVTRGIEKCPLFVLTGVCIKRVNFRENVWAFRWDKQNCLFYMGTSIKWVSVECGSTLVVRFDSVYWVLRLDVHVLL